MKKRLLLVLLCVVLGISLLISCTQSEVNVPDSQTSDTISDVTETDPPGDTTSTDTTEKQDETVVPPSDETSSPPEETTAAPESNPPVSDDSGTRLPQSDVTNQTEKDEKEPLDITSFGEWVDGKYVSTRTSWNIEFSFVEYTGEAIIIRICDNDNIGFVFNDWYYKLEVLRDGKWTQISKTNLEYAMKPDEVGYVVPSTKEDYVDLNSINLLVFLNDDTVLESGHYRITKVLSGKYFEYEFDLTID